MVSSAKMLLKTSTPSGGHPMPVVGWQIGEENGRRPTSVIAGESGASGYRGSGTVRKMKVKSVGSEPAGKL